MTGERVSIAIAAIKGIQRPGDRGGGTAGEGGKTRVSECIAIEILINNRADAALTIAVRRTRDTVAAESRGTRAIALDRSRALTATRRSSVRGRASTNVCAAAAAAGVQTRTRHRTTIEHVATSVRDAAAVLTLSRTAGRRATTNVGGSSARARLRSHTRTAVERRAATV